jgi:dihydrofolate reductase
MYIDGGKTVQSFLQADLIDELIVTQIPILLGGRVPLFAH